MENNKITKIIGNTKFINLINTTISLVTNKRKEIKVTFQGNNSYTNGELINIGLMDFLKKYSYQEITFSIIALAIHESEHIVNSSFNILKDYCSHLEKEYNSFISSVGKEINNCIEDGRIERIDKSKYKLNIKYLNCFRNIWYKEQPILNYTLVEDENKLLYEYYKVIQDNIFAICSLATMNKLPLNWDNIYKDTKSQLFIDEVLEIIQNGVLADTAKEAKNFCNDVFEIFIKYFRDELDYCSKYLKSINPICGEILEGCNEDTKASKNSRNNSLNIDSMMKDLLKDLKNDENVYNQKVEINDKTLVIKETKVNSNNTYYRSEVIKLKKQVEKIIDSKKLKNKNNLKSGKINTHDLWKVAKNENKIFMRKNKKEQYNTAIYFLIDSSGSMDGEKMQLANKIASIIEEACSRFANLEIAYFNDEHDIVRKFDDNKNKFYVWSYSKKASGGNCDFVNINIAREKLEKRTEKNKIILILSDGMPCPNDIVDNPILEVKKEVKKSKLKGISTIAIALGNNSNEYREMYKNIVFAETNNLEYKLCKIIKKVIC